ncbi:uncharacterized protein LOC133814536 [Humulus lupulus]|uniref:uncharacterized protein LOC133814536 n=1 Tax=Humulus lupulus TaxID=3486 RepID=UPI002B414979|nr:uncharacterized protein LOC133814536 [Humulus lupulus]
MFLKRYFPASKVGSIRKEICSIRQYTREYLYEYWERFKCLCASFPHHQISEQLLIQNLFEGLQSLDRSMIDTTIRGGLVDKTPAAARSLISNMAANSQQFGIRQDPNQPPKSVNEVSNSNENQLGHQLTQLTAVMYYETFSQTYNHGWHDHPNLCYGNHQQAAPQSTPIRPHGFSLQHQCQQNYTPRTMQAPQAAQPPSTKPSIEDLINAIATNMLQFQQTTQASIKSLENQVGQLAASYNRLEAHLSKESVSAITLQSGIQYEPPTKPSSPSPVQKKVVDNSIHDEPSMQKKSHNQIMPTYVPRPPFPSRMKKFKKEQTDKEILETFCKVEVNIPLLNAIKQVPCYAKFLKDLCTNKNKLKGDKNISVGENVSAVLQKKLPPKCKDPETFTIPCMIGNKRIEQCMMDLGA